MIPTDFMAIPRKLPGLVQGALASAATETLAACCNFLIGRNFLKDLTSMGWGWHDLMMMMVINGC